MSSEQPESLIRGSGPAATADRESAEFSVCVLTDGGWICVAEFQTYREAFGLAEAAASRSGLRARIKSYGNLVAELSEDQACMTAAETADNASS